MSKPDPQQDDTRERQQAFRTVSGRPVNRLYTDDDVDPSRIGKPGEYPYTRGVHPTMHRGKLWTMRQYAGFGTAEQSNHRYRYLLEQGTTGLSVAFDLPTQIGYDSDDPLAAGEVGKVGVAVDTIADVEVLFDGIGLGQVSTSMTINATAPVLLAMYVAVAQQRGVKLSHLRGTVQNDILKEYMARGTYIFPLAPSMRLVIDVIEWCARHLPKWNPVSISGYHIREAGATAAQEIAFTLADAIAYIDAAHRAGLEVDTFAPRLSFFFAVHTDLFEEVAKFRAARRLYARIMKDRFGAADPRSQMLRFHAQTGGVTLTSQHPDSNVVRVAVQSLAAVLGGAQSLHANAKDEALALPTEASAALALRTQQIIAYESGVTNTVDAVGGSYFVEKLTDDLEAEAESIIGRIDDMGGMVTAIERGWPQAQIEQAAYAHGQAVQRGERVIVGVNRFGDDQPVAIELFQQEDVAAGQIDALRKAKVDRDAVLVERALDNLNRAASGRDNLMPAIFEAVKATATIGEISNQLREVFGEYAPA